MLVDEAPADEALALRLTVARHAAPQLLPVVHVVVEDVVRDLLLRGGVGVGVGVMVRVMVMVRVRLGVRAMPAWRGAP